MYREYTTGPGRLTYRGLLEHLNQSLGLREPITQIQVGEN